MILGQNLIGKQKNIVPPWKSLEVDFTKTILRDRYRRFLYLWKDIVMKYRRHRLCILTPGI